MRSSNSLITSWVMLRTAGTRMICNTSVLCAEILRGYIRKIPAPIPNHRPLPGATRPALVMDNYRVMRNYFQTWARKSPPGIPKQALRHLVFTMPLPNYLYLIRESRGSDRGCERFHGAVASKVGSKTLTPRLANRVTTGVAHIQNRAKLPSGWARIAPAARN